MKNRILFSAAVMVAFVAGWQSGRGEKSAPQKRTVAASEWNDVRSVMVSVPHPNGVSVNLQYDSPVVKTRLVGSDQVTTSTTGNGSADKSATTALLRLSDGRQVIYTATLSTTP